MADTRSVTELLGVVSDGVVHLVRQEIRLAESEAKHALGDVRAQLGRAAPRVVLGVVIATAAAGAATIGLIRALADFVLNGQIWLAAFIVAVVLGIIAAVILRSATHIVAPRSVLSHTADSLRETSSWIRHPTQPASPPELTRSVPSAATPRPRSNEKSH